MIINLPNGHRKDVHTQAIVCPYCGTLMTPLFVYGIEVGDHLQTLTKCMNDKCGEVYITTLYLNSNSDIVKYNYKGIPLQKKVFSSIIQSISIKFVEIYNQAYYAEQMFLDSICGVGYRKSLEFLIKDYAINLADESEDDTIKKMNLSQCLDKFINDVRIKEIAKRAVWLGNDETHYQRKWLDKDVHSLKGLINLTVYWIESEEQSKAILTEMSEPK